MVNQEKTYVVRMEMEVTARSKEEAVEFFAQDVAECMGSQTLDSIVVPVAEEKISFKDWNELREFVNNSTVEEMTEMVLAQGDLSLECNIALGEYQGLYQLLSYMDRYRLVKEAIMQMPEEDLGEELYKYFFCHDIYYRK